MKKKHSIHIRAPYLSFILNSYLICINFMGKYNVVYACVTLLYQISPSHLISFTASLIAAIPLISKDHKFQCKPYVSPRSFESPRRHASSASTTALISEHQPNCAGWTNSQSLSRDRIIGFVACQVP